MGLATVQSRAAVGIEAPQVLCEVNLSPGLPMFAIVGLPETAVRESKDRVRAALKNSEFDLPSWRTTVSLAPADLPKEGSRFDLPIAVGVLIALWADPPRTLLAASALYALSGPAWWVLRRSKAAERGAA